MIGMLRGTVALKNAPSLILDVSGVGYKVFVANNVMATLGTGDELTIYTHTYVRDDALDLYGFVSYEDLKLFEMLISVSGVGCKSALGVFSIGSRSDIVNAVVRGDVGFFTAVPRLGKKNGQKIIIELKNKLGGIEDLDLSLGESNEQSDAITALQSFGFTRNEAEQAVHVVKEEGMATKELVKLALKQLGR
jgi:Holliday junction DNA helicase RuvA